VVASVISKFLSCRVELYTNLPVTEPTLPSLISHSARALVQIPAVARDEIDSLL
ncbi:MAG: hypothetical protein ACI9XZ_002963, partial [Alphaproteobacteria bacterium]